MGSPQKGAQNNAVTAEWRIAMYNFDKLVDRQGTDCIKWDMLERVYGNKDLIPLFIADMDFEVLPQLQEAMVKRAQHPTYGYTMPNPKYYESFINWNKKRNNFDLVKEEMVPIPGVVCGISFALTALTEKGDKVLVNTPVYNPFFSAIEQTGRQLVKSSLVWENGKYVMDLADMEAKMKDGVSMFILCNPHNPLGRVWTKQELEQVVELCAKYNVTVFSDEIHSDIVFAGHKHVPFLSVSEKAQEIGLLAMAPSKTFNIAGLKSSVLVIKNPEMRQKVKDLITSFHIGLDLFAYKATEVVYSEGEQWLDELNAYLLENAKFVDAYIKENLPKVKTFVPEGTYLMWLDFSAYGFTQEELMEKMKTEAGLVLNSGITYGEEGAGHVRLNIGCPKFLLEKALNQMKNVFAQ